MNEEIKQIKEILKMMSKYIAILQELVNKEDVMEETSLQQYKEKK